VLLEIVGIIWHLDAVLTRAVDIPGFVEIKRNVVNMWIPGSYWFWLPLPEHLRQTTSIDLFKRSLKTFLFEQISRSVH